MELSVSVEFLEYLAYKPPNLIFSLNIPNITFRFIAVENELLDGFINKTGIDPIKELMTGETCGFTCLHFPVVECIRYFLIDKHDGPYRLIEVIDAIKEYLKFKGRDGALDEFLESIRIETDKNQNLLLEYFDTESEKFEPLTKKIFLEKFPSKTPN